MLSPEDGDAQVEDLLRRVDAVPDLDARAPEDIVGYDEKGCRAEW